MADWVTWDGGALTADIVTSVSTTAQAEVTGHAVETGSTISDNVRVQPDTCTWEFAQSAMPTRMQDLEWSTVTNPVEQSRFQPSGLLALTMLAGAAVGAALDAIGLGADKTEQKIWVLQAKSDVDRIKEIHDTLLQVLRGAKLCTFIYHGLVLDGYILTAVQRTQQAGSGGVARFTISAQHIQTVSTLATALLGALPVPSLLDALPALPLGAKGTKKLEAKALSHISQNAASLGLNNLGGAL